MRKELLRARFGSYNYNLITPTSDKDYKVFVAPTKEDLYLGKRYVKEYKEDDIDYKVHDIRDLHKLLYKTNLNFLEGLYTDDILILGKYDLESNIDNESYKLIKEIYDMRDDIANINLRCLYNSSLGMAFNKRKIILKKKDVDEYEARKAMMTSYRILDFVERYYKSGLSDVKGAMRYNDKEREVMLSYRYESSLEEGLAILDDKFACLRKLEDYFMEFEPNKEVLERLDDLLFNITFANI